MSNLNSIISQINSLTGFSLPSTTGSYIISASGPLGSGSVNTIIGQVNQLTGYSVPGTSVTFVSGSNIANQQIVIYVPTATSGTISTDGIYPGRVIKAEHVLRIIDALNGVSPNLIILSGSLSVTGSVSMSSSLALPFIADGSVLYVSNSQVVGAPLALSASYAISASHAETSSFAVTASYLTGTIASASYAITASYADFAALAATASYLDLDIFQIATGSITASVSTDPNNLFLIKSGSTEYLNISSSGDTTLYSDFFMIKGFNSKQPVFIVSQSIVQFATQSTAPVGTANNGAIWFTSTNLYVGLD